MGRVDKTKCIKDAVRIIIAINTNYISDTNYLVVRNMHNYASGTVLRERFNTVERYGAGTFI